MLWALCIVPICKDKFKPLQWRLGIIGARSVVRKYKVKILRLKVIMHLWKLDSIIKIIYMWVSMGITKTIRIWRSPLEHSASCFLFEACLSQFNSQLEEPLYKGVSWANYICIRDHLRTKTFFYTKGYLMVKLKAWEGFLGKFGRIKETEFAHPTGTDQNVDVKWRVRYKCINALYRTVKTTVNPQ